ncbi:MAG: RNA-guided endonuclease TnpB family protein [Caldilineaceae bacterium]|nr:RNA-guided endonuclease TnpB family protein [Caldilineaceae bacterium]
MPAAAQSTRPQRPDTLIKGHRIALDPTNGQDSLFRQHCGYARVAANWALDTFRDAWFTNAGEPNEWLTDIDLRKRFNAVKKGLYPWSASLCQRVGKNAIIHMGKSLQVWGDTCRQRKAGWVTRRVGFPQHHKKGRHMAFTFTNGRNTVRVDGKQVYIPAIGWVRMREELRFAGDILSATVKLIADRWFISFQVDTGGSRPALRPGPTVGIDMGIQTLATLSDETEIENPRALEVALRDLRATDKAIARSITAHGIHNHSRRREALFAKRRRQYARVSRIRSDHHHQATTAIAKRGGTVKVETLNIDGMKRNRRLGRAIGDAGMGEFVRQLEYKCAWYGTEFVKVDRWFPSSKTCSECGAVKQSLLLSERTYHCVACGFECDRDLNAARNIQAYTPAARSAVADAETRKTDRATDTHGR